MSVANQYRRKRAAALLAAAAVVVAIPANRRAQASTVNGTVAAGEYPAGAIATQNTFTGLGDNFSELNQAFATYTPGGNLELGLTGNLEPIGNGLILFIDSRPGGGIDNGVGGFNQFGSISGQRIDNWGTDINPAAGVTAPAGGASILAPGFNPEYALEIHNSGGASYFINVIDLTLPNSPSNNRNIFIGSAALNSGLAVTHTYRRDGGATDAGDITSSFNNTNVDGVTDTSAAGAATATKGLELLFENQFLAQTPGHALRILPFITNTDGASLSNQFLPGLGAGVDNLGPANDPVGTPLFDSRTFSERFYIDVFTPTLTAGTSWLTGTWTGGAAPNGAEHSARLTGSTATSVNILAPGVTVGYLDITNPAGYAIGGGGTLSFNGGAGAAVLFVNSGNQTISSVVNVASDWRVNVASGASVSTAGLSVSAGKVITKVGPGALTFGGATMSSGAGVTLDVQRGTVAVNGNLGSGLIAATTAPDVTVGVSAGGSTAVVNFGASQTLKTLKVNADGSANLLANGARAIVANTVVLTGNAKINIADNNMVLKAMPVGTEAGG
ncbi:MAG: hypothetical protein QOE14_132, partial [Humisphaera sp.]|nr:hypothetical protein [Humisphaera sp.]